MWSRKIWAKGETERERRKGITVEERVKKDSHIKERRMKDNMKSRTTERMRKWMIMVMTMTMTMMMMMMMMCVCVSY